MCIRRQPSSAAAGADIALYVCAPGIAAQPLAATLNGANLARRAGQQLNQIFARFRWKRMQPTAE
jgi:hypothetical protein